MLYECNYNKRIICVDDESVMLDTYQRVLGVDEKDIFAEILQDGKSVDNAQGTNPLRGRLTEFDIVTVESGEEALALIKDELAKGRHFAAGFFDMRMPGGIDGYETIRMVRELDSQILCAVVTAYTDRSVEQIAELFLEEDQDQLLYFNKPFRTAELQQTAVNMVCSWNRKRNEEEQVRIIEKNRIGLECILDGITNLLWIPPRSLQTLLCGILYQSLALIHAEDGYIGVFVENDRLLIGHALGKFKDKENSIGTIKDATIEMILRKKEVFIEDRLCVVPLIYSGRQLGLIYMETRQTIVKKDEENILTTFGKQMVPLIRNSMFYEEMIKNEFQLLTDPMTGLYNRYAIYKILKNELSRSARFSFSFAILIVELDNLQSLNTTYGQEIGDLVVNGVGKLLKQSVRQYDFVGRNVDDGSLGDQSVIPYKEGGFSILLTQTGEKGARKVADRILQKVSEYTFTCEGIPVSLSFHMGLAVDVLTREKFADEHYIAGLIRKTEKNLIEKHTPKK